MTILLGFCAASFASTSADALPSKDGRRQLLSRVANWGCQYIGLDIDAIARSPLDMIVVDPSLDDATGRALTAADLARLKVKPDGKRRLVLAYLSIGEADRGRGYWQSSWNEVPPAWAGSANPAWPNSVHVQYWHPDWLDVITQSPVHGLAAIIKSGFDGVFLDRVDAYGDWQSTRPPAQDDMVSLVERLAQRARLSAPNFLIVAQNAEHLLEKSRYRKVIDAVSKESLFTGLPSPGVWNTPSDVAWSRQRLALARKERLPLFLIEYAVDATLRPELRARAAKVGAVPFFATRSLNIMPETERRGALQDTTRLKPTAKHSN